MNKYNLFFRIANEYIKLAFIFSCIFVCGLYAMYVFFYDPIFPVTNVYSSMAMTTCGVAMGSSIVSPKILCNPDIKPAKRSYMMALLPISLLHKYMIVLILALLASAFIVLISLPLEIIGNMLTTTYSPNIEIEVGGILKFFVQNRIFLLILAEMGIGLFVGFLIRKTPLALFITVIPLSFLNSFYFAYGKPMYVPMSESIICIFVAIAFLILGYQVFKRWQLANNGVLMI
jgi:hypothetical protein